ncbi:cellulose binding domain-containing protein [Actinoplanes sp. N902-109]|uniref:poly(ethylene terephthalate) hydrolase family protein n=1 Tax=Actinoplanes sp. (strain N902-109) TaxID=649831 RepID=UPI0003294BB2|nr:cellulose binding domain-containing protein [Actinoplanes sp. N902-109]AGL16332.1 secreted lipase [Actinoplanes sp. N902-109]
MRNTMLEPAPPALRRRYVACLATAVLAVAAAVTAILAPPSAYAADNPYQRGPDPTVASVAATRGTFATAQLTVPPGNGFGGGYIYYPTDTSHGTWGAVAIVPGYSALFANEEAWMGPWLASFGFVVIGVETNTRSDGADARATELLAALDYLTQQSAVRDRVDAGRLAVMGHSAGGAGTILAAERRPALKAAVGLAPGTPGSLSLATDKVPMMVIGGQTDPTVTPAYLDNLYAGMPTTTPSDFVQIAGADHLFFTRANNTEMKVLIPWLKIFLDNDTRYTQFLCPSLADPSGISLYRSKCPYLPPGTTSPSPSSSVTPSSPSSPSSPSTGCTAGYRTVGQWPGGFQGEVTVTAGSAAISGWTVNWTLGSGQSVTQLWNGTLTTSGSAVTVRNASYSGSVPAGGSVVFGYLADGTPSTPLLTCTGQ